jgi:HPt (histidine-containing phosphotransfer) domain-containing protein
MHEVRAISSRMMSVLDRNALRTLQEVIGGDRADLVDLITSFLDEAPQILESMSAAAEAGDAVTARRTAHTLKSNARDFGAGDLSVRCASLEADLAGRESFDGLSGRVAEILALWPAARAALEAEIARDGAEG